MIGKSPQIELSANSMRKQSDVTTGIERHWKIAGLIALGLGILLYFLFAGWGYDDPYITLRYAENLSEGIGFVYNPGEKILSTTSPLFAILLSILRNTWIDLPRLAVLIGVISIPLGGLFIWDLGHTWRKPIVGWMGFLLYPLFPLLLNTLSSETPVYLFFCLGAFSWYARKRYNLTAVFCALAFLTRPDGGLVFTILAIHHLTNRRQDFSWQPVGLFLAITLPWILFATIYFGSPIPVTLAAKQQQGAMMISQRFASGISTILSWGYSTRFQYWIIAGLAILGFLYVLRQNRQWGLFLSWPVFHFVAYSILGVSRYFWYYVPLIPGVIVAAALGKDRIYNFLQHRFPRHKFLINLACYALFITIILLQFEHLHFQSNHPDKRVKIYRAVGEWIDTHTEKDEWVGTLEVGIIGYYAKRPMVDFAGILQPEIAKQLTPKSTYKDSTLWSIQIYRPDYLVLNPNWFPQLMKNFINPYCQAQEDFQGESYGYTGELIIYHCDWHESIIDVTQGN